MAVPKRKISRSRRGMRRSHYARRRRVPNFARCDKCEQPILPHTVCPNCGFYSGRVKAVVIEHEPE